MTTLPPRLGVFVLRRFKKPKGENVLAIFPWKSGAGDESRTRDLNLGKVALYQLSYSRTKSSILTGLHGLVK